ncbi:MAG: NAD-dependent epimerase/dehydratase family protein, partial [Alphaproteobacteria bacterium]
GQRRNLDNVRTAVGAQAWAGFELIDGDVRDPDSCLSACRGVDVVLHQAALGSVGLSIDDPLYSHAVNVTGTVNMLQAVRETGARLVYAASSAAYGDCEDLPAREDRVGKALSPYGLGKYVNELYAGVFARNYGVEAIGLRYFNVYGPRQDPNGPYAAVIPKWIDAFFSRQTVFINGDGKSTRDFCYVQNVVKANLLAALSDKSLSGQVFNVAGGQETSLNDLYDILAADMRRRAIPASASATHREALPGEVRRSRADIELIRQKLGYEPEVDLLEGLSRTVNWFAPSAH